jgi:hypothetical protein
MAGDIIGVNGDYIALTGANLPIKNNEKSAIDKQINIFFILFAVGQSPE